MHNTFAAHQLLHWAGEMGRKHDLKQALFTAHFTHRRDLSDRGVLADVAGEIGLDRDEALAVLKKHGLRQALVSAGGDIVAGAAPPGKEGWRVALIALREETKPEFLWLTNAAVATSGDLYQFLEVDGTRYSHIVDPRTGTALTEQRLVHVLAPDAITADSLATAISVLGPSEGLHLVVGDKRLGARVALGQVRVVESPVFRAWPRAE